MTARHLNTDAARACDIILDALCDGALIAIGLNRSSSRPLEISPANWAMVKHEGATLHYTVVEISTFQVLRWLGVVPTDPHASTEATPGTSTPSEAFIRSCIRAVYGAADAQNIKAPNINEIAPLANKLMLLAGKKASASRIRDIASQPEFKDLRGSVGSRSEKGSLSELVLTKDLLPP